jgi:tetratricopeptide (TPR) repeat protein
MRVHPWPRRLPLAILVAASVVYSATAQVHSSQAGPLPVALAQANAALQAGEADKALALLRAVPQSDASLAQAANLECRVRMTLEQWDAAISACERAIRIDGQNSNYHAWLGRALGEKADRASFLTAFGLAKRVRSEFEEAVRLDPRNASALADLGQFYEQAPGVVGGGIEKAGSIAAQLESVDPTRAHHLRGQIAEQRKDYGTAEREYKQAITSSPYPGSQWMELAGFYRRRQRWGDMESAIRSGDSAAQRDRVEGLALFDGASLLTETHRDPVQAAKMLDDYLAGSAKTEEAPAFAALIRLAHLRDQLGDPAAANRERAAALAMANEYKPAEDAGH